MHSSAYGLYISELLMSRGEGTSWKTPPVRQLVGENFEENYFLLAGHQCKQASIAGRWDEFANYPRKDYSFLPQVGS